MIALCIAAFFSFGVVLVLVGSNQAALASELSLDLEQTGLLSGALALGAGFGITAAGPLYDRYPRRPLFMGSAGVAAAALLTVHSEVSFNGLFMRIVIAGLGAGAYNTMVNAAVAERYGSASARPLAIVHASATVGAIVGPPMCALVVHWTHAFHLAGGAHVIIALWGLRFGESKGVERVAKPVLPSLRKLGPMLAVVFGYVSIEGTCTVFAVPYALQHLALDPARGQAAISALWIGVLAGRAALLALGARAGPRTITIAGFATVVAVLVSIGSTTSYVELVFGAIGLCVGSVYPLTMAIIGQRFVKARGTAAGLAGGAGALGAVIATWLTGLVGDRMGIGVALLSLAGWAALIVAGGALMSRR